MSDTIIRQNRIDIDSLLAGGGGGSGAQGPVIDVTTIPDWPASGASIVNAFNQYADTHPSHIMYFPAGTYRIDWELRPTSYTICDKNVNFDMYGSSAYIGTKSAEGKFYWEGGYFSWKSGDGSSLFYGHDIRIVDVTCGGPSNYIAYLYGTIAKFTAENCDFIGDLTTFVSCESTTGASARINAYNCRIGMVMALIEGKQSIEPFSVFNACLISGSSWSNIMLRHCLRTTFVGCSIQIDGVMNYEGVVAFCECRIYWTASLPSGATTSIPSLSFIGCNFEYTDIDPTNMLSISNSAANTWNNTIIK